MNNLRLLLISILVLLGASALAQKNGVIMGSVKALNTGKVLKGASITADGIEVNTVSDQEGNYKLTLPVGIYTLRANFIGYQNVEKYNIVLTTGNAQIINFELTEISSSLETVVINFNQNKSGW